MGDDEDKANYGTGWQILNGINAQSEFYYQSAEKLKTYPFIGRNAMYGGGGYLVALKGTVGALVKKIKSLQETSWIDKYTRAVIIDFTVYNAQVNLFASVTYVAEFLNSNSIDPYYIIAPMNLLGYGMVYIIFQGIFAAMIIFLIVKESRNIWKKKRKYLTNFWSLIDFCIVIFCVSSLGIYVIRFIETSKLTKIFAESAGDAYVNFQSVTYWDQIFNVLMGFAEFLGTVKFIRLLRFNSYMNMLALTLQYDSRTLISFMLMFAIMFSGFVMFFYLIYNTYLTVFLTFLNSMMTCFQMLIGKFNYPQMQKSNPIIGPLIFFIYNCVILFLMISMFQTILTKAFQFVRKHIDEVSDDKTMMQFIINRFFTVTGLDNILYKLGIIEQQTSKLPKADNDNFEMEITPDAIATLERLPSVIDRLLVTLTDIGMHNEKWDTAHYMPLLTSKTNNKDAFDVFRRMVNKEKSHEKINKVKTMNLPEVEEVKNESYA